MSRIVRATLYLPDGEIRRLSEEQLHQLNPYQSGDEIVCNLDAAAECVSGRADVLVATPYFAVLGLTHGPELLGSQANHNAGLVLTLLTDFDWLKGGGVYGPILLIELDHTTHAAPLAPQS